MDLKTNKLWFSDEMYHIFGYDSNINLDKDLQKLEITYDMLMDIIVHPEGREVVDKT